MHMDETRRYWGTQPEIEVLLPGGGSFQEFALGLDTLKEITPDIGTRQRYGAGGIDPGYYVIIVLFAINAYSTGFLQRAGEQHYDAFRDWLIRLWNDHREYVSIDRKQNNGSVPVGFVQGNLQFNFHEELNKEELIEQLLSAAEKVEEMPQEVLLDSQTLASRKPLSLFWDRGSKLWIEGPPKN